LWSFVSFVVKKVALKSIQPDGVLACVAGLSADVHRVSNESIVAVSSRGVEQAFMPAAGSHQ